MNAPNFQLPVTIIGGYLGAGKTTLVNHLLRHGNGIRLAVLVNEFGDLPIDSDLIENQHDNVINISGGCVCCSYGSDLMSALIDLKDRVPRPDHLLIEASGVSMPSGIAQSVKLLPSYTIDSVIVLADAETAYQQANDRYLGDTIERQLKAADIVILNKIDLVNDEFLVNTRRWLSEQFAGIRILETTKAKIPLSTILAENIESANTIGKSSSLDVSEHMKHESVAFPVEHAVDAEVLAKFFASSELDLIRSKGVVRASDGRYRTVQTVGRRWMVVDAPTTAEYANHIVCITHKPPMNVERISEIISNSRLSSENQPISGGV